MLLEKDFFVSGEFYTRKCLGEIIGFCAIHTKCKQKSKVVVFAQSKSLPLASKPDRASLKSDDKRLTVCPPAKRRRK